MIAISYASGETFREVHSSSLSWKRKSRVVMPRSAVRRGRRTLVPMIVRDAEKTGGDGLVLLEPVTPRMRVSSNVGAPMQFLMHPWIRGDNH